VKKTGQNHEFASNLRLSIALSKNTHFFRYNKLRENYEFESVSLQVNNRIYT